ncbi:MAG: hypothetical protein ABS79_07495 [Planctomycetes bacterium SCN 63-9]|nr:MAG: hypothetical protein ABS79_07495 [Planctomycetes bacterium SCN 63-9]
MDVIDRAALKYGMPMGPIALMDLIGLDTVSSIFKVMAEGYPDRAEPCPLLTELVQTGRLGRKTGAGFRTFEGRTPAPTSQAVTESGPKSRASENEIETEIIDRLFLTMLLEATRTLDEGIVRDPGDVDLGVMLGLAFPKQRGGLFRWADSLGGREILDRLERLQHLGDRFQPTERLQRMAQTDGTFYPREGY